MNLKRTAAVFAPLLMLCMLTGCGESEADYQQDDMPYGSTIVEDNSRSFTMSYDKRFFDDELLDKIAGYYLAIQERDAAAFDALMFPPYHKYQNETVYEGSVTDQDILDNTYQTIGQYFGMEFDWEYSFIDITALLTKEGESDDRDAMVMMLDKIAEDQGEEAVSKETQALCELRVTRYIEPKGENSKAITDYAMQDEVLYAIKYQDQWYLMYS